MSWVVTSGLLLASVSCDSSPESSGERDAPNRFKPLTISEDSSDTEDELTFVDEFPPLFDDENAVEVETLDPLIDLTETIEDVGADDLSDVESIPEGLEALPEEPEEDSADSPDGR